MPRYFLHVHGGFVAVDNEGVDFPDLAAAREEAIIGLRDIIAQEVKNGRVPTYVYIDIIDEAGARLAVVAFDDAIKIFRKAKAK